MQYVYIYNIGVTLCGKYCFMYVRSNCVKDCIEDVIVVSVINGKDKYPRQPVVVL